MADQEEGSNVTAPAEWGRGAATRRGPREIIPGELDETEPLSVELVSRGFVSRRLVEGIVALGALMIVGAVGLLCAVAWGVLVGVGCGLAVAGVLTIAWALVIVDVPDIEPVHTVRPDGEG